MIIRTVSTLAMHCPHCGRTELHDISWFDIKRSESYQLVCRCGQVQARVRMGDGQYLLDVPCLICGTHHVIPLDYRRFWTAKLDEIYCAQERLELGFIGERSLVDKKIACFRNEFNNLIREIDAEDQIENPSVLFEVLNLVHDFAAKSRIFCSCGSQSVKAEVLPNGVEVRCLGCGAVRFVSACTEGDADYFKSLNAIHIRAKYYFHEK